ncbi:MAG: ATP-binding protein [Acidimicrobiales bacterium]
MPEVGSATATILFTDLAGSTELRAQLGEERADELRRVHDRLLGEAVAAHHGRVVKSLGDGILAAFTAAADALGAAVGIQQAAHAYSQAPDALGTLAVRVGLSVGDVSWEAGDCFGTPVVEAARLEAVAEPGQILCSEFVRVMARGRGGHVFDSLGFLELKGLPEPLAACSVRWSPQPEADRVALPSALTVEGPALLGRRAELEHGAAFLAEPGPGRALWLLGEPGIGKTRLAAELARAAYEDGAVVLFGRCSRDLAVPYQPFIECLRHLAAHTSDDRLAARLGPAAGELTRLLPELAGRLSSAPPAGGAGDVERYRLFEAVRGWLTAASPGAPLVLVLDDLHWATDATVALLGHVLRTPLEARVKVIGTARTTAPDLNAALVELADDLEAAGRAQTLALQGLEVVDLGAVTATADEAALLHDQSGGNPLFVEMLQRSDRGGGRGGLASAVRRRMGGLSGEVREMLALAAHAGLELDLPVLAHAAGADELAALDRLDAAAEAGLLRSVGPNAYRWVHDLVRETLEAEANPARAARVHARLAAALEAVHARTLDAHAAALAHHWWMARAVSGTAAALRWTLHAAERADAQVSFLEAAELYGRAAELAEDADGQVRHRLSQGWALDIAGEFFDAMAVFGGAGDHAAALGLDELALEAAIGFEQAGTTASAHGGAAVARLEAALAAAGDAPASLVARGTAGLGRALGFSGRFDEARRVGERAVELARATDEPNTVLCALLAMTWLAGMRHLSGDEHAAIALEARELLDRDAMDHHVRTETVMQFWIAACYLGDPTLLAEAERASARLKHLSAVPFHQMLFLLHAASQALCEARLADAEAGFDAASAAHARSKAAGDGQFTERRFLLLRAQGRLAELLPALALMRRLAPDARVWRPGAAALYAELGLVDDASAELAALAADGFAALGADGTRMLQLTYVVDAVVSLQDASLAPTLYAELAPLAGRGLVWMGPGFALGSADRHLGALAALCGDHAAADAHFAAAVGFDARMGWPLWLAHDHYEWGRALAARGDPRAAAALDLARDLAERFGLAGLSARLERR